MHRMSQTVGLALLMVCHGADAQSLNIDFGLPADGPSSSYAAAGLPGYWNSIPAYHGTTTFNLKNLAGVATPVQLQQIGGTELLTTNDPMTGGDHGRLMDDYLVTYSASLESCLFIRNLEPGWYEMLTYAWMPSQSAVKSYTSCDEEPGFPHYQVGGAWADGHQQIVTYSRHFAQPDATFLRIRAHSGIVPGANPAMGAALNGIQLRKLKAGDVTHDGAVNVQDILSVIGAWGPCPPTSSCMADMAPYPMGNGVVNVQDLLLVIQNWG